MHTGEQSVGFCWFSWWTSVESTVVETYIKNDQSSRSSQEDWFMSRDIWDNPIIYKTRKRRYDDSIEKLDDAEKKKKWKWNMMKH